MRSDDEMDGSRVQSASSIEEQSNALRTYVKDTWTCKGIAIQATGRRCFTVALPQVILGLGGRRLMKPWANLGLP